jgi:predicted nuclease of predicted toxin-antitoxin system
MKFLIDRCAGSTIARWLQAKGHDVVEARSLGPDPGDKVLLQWAESQGRILVTIDTDFGKLIYAERSSHSGLVRLPDVPATRRIQLLDQVLHSYGSQIARGAVVTVRGERIRISHSRTE